MPRAGHVLAKHLRYPFWEKTNVFCSPKAVSTLRDDRLPMNREAPPRMLLADHNADVRRALALSLHTALDFEVVGEATDAAGLSIAGSEQADLLIIDWQIVVSNEAGLLAQLRSLNQGLRIIVLSTRLEDRAAALAAGADAFICKGDSPERVLATVRLVLWPNAGSEIGASTNASGTPVKQ